MRGESFREALMRSRYTAYCLGKLDYVLATYVLEQRNGLTTQALSDGASGTEWKRLEVLGTKVSGNTGEVEFKAFYLHQKRPHVMHELSQFELEDTQWKYRDGVFGPDNGPLKLSRNQACICGSSKKSKRCCLR